MNTDGLRALWKQAFGDTDDFLDGFFRTGFSPDRCKTIEKDGRVAAMLYWFDCVWKKKKIAYLYAVATDIAFRNQGLCRALMEDTHRHLQECGYHGAVLVPGNKGLFSLYEKMGYVPFCGRKTFTAEKGTEAASVASLSPIAYFTKRISRLPRNSVLQDLTTFEFLATFCGLYESGDCLFSGGMEGSAFYFQEFLGDPENAPGILAALGAEKGILRIPGDAHFAMYRPLDGSKEMPAHFDIPLN